MKTITIGRIDCDIVISDANISRKHATMSLVNGQYVYNDISKNGTVINGKLYHNEKVVIAPGTPVYLANKVLLPWPQILMLLPNSPIKVHKPDSTIHHHAHKPDSAINPGVSHSSEVKQEPIGAGWGIASFLFPLLGFILYFVWKDTEPYKAKQAANIAWISVAISFVLGFISGLTM